MADRDDHRWKVSVPRAFGDGLLAEVEVAGPGTPVDAPAEEACLARLLINDEQRLRGRDVVARRQVLRDLEPGKALGQLPGTDVEAYPAAHIFVTKSRCSRL